MRGLCGDLSIPGSAAGARRVMPRDARDAPELPPIGRGTAELENWKTILKKGLLA